MLCNGNKFPCGQDNKPIVCGNKFRKVGQERNLIDACKMSIVSWESNYQTSKTGGKPVTF